jgi:hypothetical protein
VSPRAKGRIWKGYPTSSFGVDPGDGREVNTYADFLRRHGLTLAEVVESIGGPPATFLPFKEARSFVRTLGLPTMSAWTAYAKSDSKPENIPADPFKYYGDEFKGIGDWLGTGNVAPQNMVFRDFESARDFARSLRVGSKEGWAAYCKSGKKPSDIPANPSSVYEETWVSWPDWVDGLGLGRHSKFNFALSRYDEIIQAAIKSGVRPSSHTEGEVPGYPGLRWNVLDNAIKRNFAPESLSSRVEHLSPSTERFTLEEFRAALIKEGLVAWPAYKEARINGALDDRYSGDPQTYYGMKWSEIVAPLRDELSEADFRKAMTKLQAGMGRNITRREYEKLWQGEKLPVGCPGSPMSRYGKRFADLMGHTKTVKDLKIIEQYVLKENIRRMEYVELYEHGLLPEGFPSPSTLTSKWGFRFPQGAPTGFQHHGAHEEKLVRRIHREVAKGTKSAYRIAKDLGCPYSLAQRISNGTHWSCREEALT